MNRMAAAAVLLIAIVSALGAVLLGNWQLRRAESKRALQQAYDTALAATPLQIETAAQLPASDAKRPRRVRVQGRFLHEHTVFLDNRMWAGQPGFYVVTPLALPDAAVLVVRGWAPQDVTDRARLPLVDRPDGVVEIEALLIDEVPRRLQLGADSPQGRIRQNLNVDELRARLPLPLAPAILQQLSPLPDGLVRDWPRPATGVDKHQGYAVQWFSLAALIIVLAVVFGWRAWQRQRGA
ncbi:MAG: SURF1 family protein [Sutterellaceae bacterium]|nr:SURF1 family protein [Burkholderiaceae bacterium]MCX7901030.1 SURF1 family protein [Burkholderiaceae bacterium]MDW8429429.1 SURF1 family protein [Sutterellaceae bacterium]